MKIDFLLLFLFFRKDVLLASFACFFLETIKWDRGEKVYRKSIMAEDEKKNYFLEL